MSHAEPLPVLNGLECLICLSMFLPNFHRGLGLQRKLVPLHQMLLLRSIWLMQKSWQNFGKMSHGYPWTPTDFMESKDACLFRRFVQELKQLGVCLYAAEDQFFQPVAPHQPHGDRKWALVIGSEFSGVSEEIVRECDQRVCVPQQQGHSLNVAHACSICLSCHNMGHTAIQAYNH